MKRLEVQQLGQDCILHSVTVMAALLSLTLYAYSAPDWARSKESAATKCPAKMK